MSKTFLYAIVLTCMFTGVLLANEGKAQHKSIHEVFVSLELDNAAIKDVLDVIEEQTDFKFVYSGETDVLTDDQRITLKVDNESVAFVLKQIAGETGFIFQQNDGLIGIGTQKKRKQNSLKTSKEALPERTITGKVRDETGEPLAGANIVMKNTSIGTVTDVDGKYVISVPDDATTLIFSYIGYSPMEVEIAGRSAIDVVLHLDITTLGGVTVSTGYWESNQRESTGNISKVSSKVIGQQSVASPLQTLQGRVPGLNVTQISGVPGGAFRIRIRGQNSVRTGDANDPLFVIDGVPYPTQNLSGHVGASVTPSPLNALNPSDIESIEVLKDADATAIYGSLGANGVVLITTKKGEVDKTTVDINVFQGVGEITKRADLLNTEQYLEMRNEAFANDGSTPGSIFPDHDLLTWDTDRSTDWQEELIGGSSNQTSVQASVSGGNTNTQFRASGGYYRETTVFPKNFPYQKGSLHFDGSHKSNNEKFNISFVSNLIRENSTLPVRDPTSNALSLPPNAPEPFDKDGKINWEDNTWSNPYAALLKEHDGVTTNLITNLSIGYQLLPGLVLKSTLGYNLIRNDVSQITPIATQRPSSNFGGESLLSNNEVKTWITEPQLVYTNSFDKGELEVLVGTTFRETIQSRVTLLASGFTSDAVINDLQAASDLGIIEDFYTEYKYNAVFGRIGFNWDRKYFINFTGRRDGSSRFGPENRFANFGALGTAWIFSRENFLEGSSLVSFGKLRFSYGTVGNDQIGDYRFLPGYSSFFFSYQGVNPLLPERLGNPEFQWERTRKMELAIDLGFLKDHIFLTATHYRNRISNQLVDLPIPTATGFPSITSNLDAVVENTGFEFEIKSINIDRSNFNWTTSINLTVPRNELVEYPNLEGSSFANRYRVGEPLTIRLVNKSLGVDPETGVYQFQDFDEDESISFPNDRQEIIDPVPEYYGGLQNSINYKGLELNFFIQFVKQKGGNYHSFFTMPGLLSNQPAIVMERWQNPGDNSNVQRFSSFAAFTPWSNQRDSNAGYLDASFVRLKNVSLSYQIPQQIIQRWRLQNVRLYMQAQNLLTFTSYDFLDPEQPGILPPIRMVTGGLQLTF